MRLNVEPAIFARFPGLRIAVVVATGIDNQRAVPAIAERWRTEWLAAGATAQAFGNAQSHPRVRPWRTRFQAMGVSGKSFPSSIEAMLRRAMKGGELFQINPLVDFYNAVSLCHVVPAGGFALDQLRGDLDLRLTRDGDRFTALDGVDPLAVPAGEVAYADDDEILTRHLVWRQARRGLITPATRSVVLVSEVLGEIEAGVVEAVQADLAAGLTDHFAGPPHQFLADEARPIAEW
jgi:DNA/RNA-binding domain of Phe-tRNA-synthetase-like protein